MKKGRYSGATIDEFRVEQAVEWLDEALQLLPPESQLREWPKLGEARDKINNAIIELANSGVDIHPRPTLNHGSTRGGYEL